MTALEATDEVVTPWRRFVGANIKGTPAISADKVGEDVEVLRRTASIIVTQETRWAWYWKRIGKVLAIVLAGRPSAPRRAAAPAKWQTAPSIRRAIAQPVRAASSVMWKGRHWRRARTVVRKLHKGFAKISEARWLRAVLLVDWDTGLAVWAATCHFVVGGDEAGDGPTRREILAGDLGQLDRLLDDLVATGHPILFQLDANIHTGTDAYRRLRRIIHEHGGQIIGDHGVEFLFVIPGRDTDLEVRNPRGFTIGPKAHGGPLNTDHEARGVTFRLRRRPR